MASDRKFLQLHDRFIHADAIAMVEFGEDDAVVYLRVTGGPISLTVSGAEAANLHKALARMSEDLQVPDLGASQQNPQPYRR
jgi:hypothetical protein